MAKKPVLVVMAAGMGSRYGGLKQIDPVGACGEAILDYSLFDAYEAGFETAVIIIKEAIAKDFMETVGKRLERCPLEIRYAYQELTALPDGYTVPEGRTKPWGTCHAILCAKDAIDDAPFAVINADDFYGKAAYRAVYQALCSLVEQGPGHHCLVGYQLGNTVTENGSVARGVCQVDENDMLTRIDERTRIEQYPGGIHFTEDGGETWTELTADTVVSMNMWGFGADFLDKIQGYFHRFLENEVPGNPVKAECYLPMAVADLMYAGKADVKVLSSQDKWYGVTYAADKATVVAAIADMTQQGLYPQGLWK